MTVVWRRTLTGPADNAPLQHDAKAQHTHELLALLEDIGARDMRLDINFTQSGSLRSEDHLFIQR